MTTNLLASVIVTIATNVTEVPTRWEWNITNVFEIAPNQWRTDWGGYYSNLTPAGPLTEKLVTSNVVETTTLSFDWHGKREIKVDRVLSSACWLLKKRVQETWERQEATPVSTNVLNSLTDRFRKD